MRLSPERDQDAAGGTIRDIRRETRKALFIRGKIPMSWLVG